MVCCEKYGRILLMSTWPQECETGTKEAEIMGIQESSSRDTIGRENTRQ